MGIKKRSFSLKEQEPHNKNIVMIELKQAEGLAFLTTIKNESVDLVLTDPPYIISKSTGMNEHYNRVKENPESLIKTEDEWKSYQSSHCIEDTVQNKSNYMTYGSIYGKKYCVQTDYGTWDSEFTMEVLDQFVCEYYKKLKQGGTLIMFFDIWKLTPLKEMFERHKFKQIRFIEWIKTNPQPVNSNVNYLTNCREMALVGIKGSKPTFHSKYDNGIYMFPLQVGKYRIHPTQKSIRLFEELIKKHSDRKSVV